MFCPLKFSTWHKHGPAPYEQLDPVAGSECDQEKCAWWNRYSHNVGGCAIKTLALRLDDMLEKELPVRS